jgi:flagellar hook-associated protein 3 FlgL
MAVTPINIARVSQNLKSFNLLTTTRASQAGLFRVQNQLATGLKFLTPSEDPTGSAKALVLQQAMERLEQLEVNVRDANASLAAGEHAMQDAIDLLTQASTLASEQAGDTVSAGERAAAGVLVESLIDQFAAVGNRRHLDSYLFGGQRSDSLPFQGVGRGIMYTGDAGRQRTIVESDLTQEAFTVSGESFFGAVSAGVRGVRDLDPDLTDATRIADLRGTTGDGVRLGRIRVTAGAERVEIDLSGAATVGDVIDKLNAELPPLLSAQIEDQGIAIVQSGIAAPDFMVEDVGAGQAARDLGLHQPTPGIAAGGANLDPIVTSRTRLSELNAGAGLDLAGGLTIRNGDQSATIDLSEAETVEDVLNLINETKLGVRAQISADGRAIDVLNLVSGASMSIEEDGGQLATNLGIRSLHGSTLLSELNSGLGVETIDGDDVRFITSNGTTIDVDLDGATTVQDVIDRFNAAGGGAVTASLGAAGSGFQITDNTSGGGPFRIERINHSPAIDGLGLSVNPVGDALNGTNPNPQRVDSAFTALFEMRDALEASDSRAISLAAQRLDAVVSRMQEVQGRTASLARSMEDRALRIEDTKSATEIFLSDVRDVDIADAVVRFQQVENALQANLATSSRIMGLSLIDYLR